MPFAEKIKENKSTDMVCLRLYCWSFLIYSLGVSCSPIVLNIIYRMTTFKFLSPAQTSFPESSLAYPIAYSISLLGYYKPNIASSSPNLLHPQSLLPLLMTLSSF